jgi:molybdopterin synthase sulfur carrier subunit
VSPGRREEVSVPIVRIPTQLQTLTSGEQEVEASGATLAELLDDLERRYPGTGERIRDDSGALRRFVNIYLDDEDVRFLDGVATPVPQGAKVSIVPAVAGGG